MWLVVSVWLLRRPCRVRSFNAHSFAIWYLRDAKWLGRVHPDPKSTRSRCGQSHNRTKIRGKRARIDQLTKNGRICEWCVARRHAMHPRYVYVYICIWKMLEKPWQYASIFVTTYYDKIMKKKKFSPDRINNKHGEYLYILSFEFGFIFAPSDWIRYKEILAIILFINMFIIIIVQNEKHASMCAYVQSKRAFKSRATYAMRNARAHTTDCDAERDPKCKTTTISVRLRLHRKFEYYPLVCEIYKTDKWNSNLLNN